MHLIFDIETNGLLHDLTAIHCLCVHDLDTDETYSFNDSGGHPIVRGVELLEDADTIIGHNIIGFDLPCLRSIYPWLSINTSLDTLLLSRLFHPNILDIDQDRKWAGMPTKLRGRHSLEAWGYRLKVNKSDFGKTTDWQQWSPGMEAYCKQDVLLTTKLWKHFLPKITAS